MISNLVPKSPNRNLLNRMLPNPNLLNLISPLSPKLPLRSIQARSEPCQLRRKPTPNRNDLLSSRLNSLPTDRELEATRLPHYPSPLPIWRCYAGSWIRKRWIQRSGGTRKGILTFSFADSITNRSPMWELLQILTNRALPLDSSLLRRMKSVSNVRVHVQTHS